MSTDQDIKYHYTIDHKDNYTFFEQLMNQAGGELLHNEKVLKIHNRVGDVLFHRFTHFDQLRLVVQRCNLNEKVSVEHIPSDVQKNYIFFVIHKSGAVHHMFKNEETISLFGKDSHQGVVITNFMNSLTNIGEKNIKSEWVSLVVKKSFILELLEEVPKGFKEFLLSDKPWLLFEPVNYTISQALHDIFSQTEEYQFRNFKIYGNAIDLVGEVLKHMSNRNFEDVNNLSSQDTKRMFEVKEYICSDLSNPPTLEDICKEFGLSRSKLIRDFKTEFGVPVYQFYNKMRMQNARELLVEKGLTVTEVSQNLGYKGLSKFSDAFKNFYGVSPKSMVEQYKIK
ncbi:AraC family transcriptional regulator [Flammeovirga yaeyamensis]|uniref:AraC family transcriptional regulator n=1 Tax=Flammeovirga yaeyamensis TaxID=367791 RepID=A0AAX1N011_9BACT|nr:MULTISPECIES: AraC family transcriptional regulator [Flammeovirga]ANQ47688.1 helix-turn-helix transcriptional regulator [Flammeovirga sp. MY04]MBB3700146.1 AraC-like DNA-binding protein [Flammeovirga yaeyamensis]NMF37224.1 helix-turn-helix transcriptional regulator [Flammeovirga yaeyamensis]QWG00913.1 AraC family transcriptional regulator [Flammeovirga yaeyamensis]